MGLFRETSNNLKKRSFLTAANKQLSGARSINRSVIKKALRQDFARKEGGVKGMECRFEQKQFALLLMK